MFQTAKVIWGYVFLGGLIVWAVLYCVGCSTFTGSNQDFKDDCLTYRDGQKSISCQDQPW